jgi:hypothetical protein
MRISLQGNFLHGYWTLHHAFSMKDETLRPLVAKLNGPNKTHGCSLESENTIAHFQVNLAQFTPKMINHHSSQFAGESRRFFEICETLVQCGISYAPGRL